MLSHKNLVVFDSRKLKEIDWKIIWENKEPEIINFYPNIDQLRQKRLQRFLN